MSDWSVNLTEILGNYTIFSNQVALMALFALREEGKKPICISEKGLIRYALEIVKISRERGVKEARFINIYDGYVVKYYPDALIRTEGFADWFYTPGESFYDDKWRDAIVTFLPLDVLLAYTEAKNLLFKIHEEEKLKAQKQV